MPAPPLADSVVFSLRTDPTAALAAVLVISDAHRELMKWAVRLFHGEAPSEVRTAFEPEPRRKVQSKRKAASKSKSNGHGRASYGAARRSKRDADDQALLEAMRSEPDATINDWAAAIGKPRTSAVSGLQRLRLAGRVVNEDAAWSVVEPEPRRPAAKWVEPLRTAAPAH